MTRHGLRSILPLLAGSFSLLLAGTAVASDSPDDFFLGGSAGPAESLDAAIAGAGFGGLAGATPNSLDSTRQSLSLQEISSDEMASAGVGGLLGLIANARIQALSSTAAPLGTWGQAATGTTSVEVDRDGSVRLSLDDVVLALDNLNIELVSSLVSFGDGYAIIDSTTSINPNGSLHLEVSSQVYTSLTAIDRDGLPGSQWARAGAITVDRMAISIPQLEVDIQGYNPGFTGNDNLLSINTYSPGEITVDMANSLIGVAPASSDGGSIGASTPILRFGPNGGITVAAGTRVNAVLARPDGLRTAFVTLNGRVGDISVRDLRVLDTVGGGDIRIGRLNVRDLNLVNTRLFVQNQTFTVDVGRGIENVAIDVERLYLGNDIAGAVVGDFYASGGRINELRFSVRAH